MASGPHLTCQWKSYSSHLSLLTLALQAGLYEVTRKLALPPGPRNTLYVSVLDSQIHYRRGFGGYVSVMVESEAPGIRGTLTNHLSKFLTLQRRKQGGLQGNEPPAVIKQK